jgi:ABC-type transport system substrate-binding protein
VNVAPEHVLARVPDLDENLPALGVAAGAWHVTARTEDSVTLDARSEAPAVRRIVFRTYPSTDSLLSALDRGEVDVVSGLPAADAERVRALPGVTVNHAPDGTQYVLRNDIADARLRRAVSLAIDRTDLVAKTVDGVGTPGVVPIPARGSAWTLDDTTVRELTASLDAQPARARQLVEAARPGRPLRLLAAGDAAGRRVAEYLTGALERVGLQTEIVDGPPYDLLLVRRPTTRDTALVDRAEVEQLTRDARLVGLFEPDTLQAFRSDNVAGWLRTPQVRSLAVFAPTTTQYSQLVAAPPPPGEEASTSTYVIGAIGVLAVCGVAFAVAAWIRRRSIA